MKVNGRYLIETITVSGTSEAARGDRRGPTRSGRRLTRSTPKRRPSATRRRIGEALDDVRERFEDRRLEQRVHRHLDPEVVPQAPHDGQDHQRMTAMVEEVGVAADR